MANRSKTEDFIDRLSTDISDEVGNIHEDELSTISDDFDKVLLNALNSFNSSLFDNDGFIKKMRDIDIDESDKKAVKNVLNNMQHDYISAESINHSDILIRRDIASICKQMPEMRDSISMIRDSIIECNVATGEVSRSLTFENHENNAVYESKVKEVEKTYDLLMGIKNFIVPQALEKGVKHIHVVPYAKLFAELEMIKERSNIIGLTENTVFKESIPNVVKDSFKTKKTLYTEDNLSLLLESTSAVTKANNANDIKSENNNLEVQLESDDKILKQGLTTILESIEVYNGSSELYAEMGNDGFKDFIFYEYSKFKEKNDEAKGIKKEKTDQHFMEAMGFSNHVSGEFGRIDQEDVDISNYKNIKGAYVKYLDDLKMIPVTMDRRVVGYYYSTTTIDLHNSAIQPNGIVDLSLTNYSKDRSMIDQLANIIIRSFDKKMLERNIKLKNEIVEIIMAHKFSEGRLSFIYIPENEIIRLPVNEDENGKGHSVIEPSLFPARMYSLANMHNMMYVLNNNTTRIHYLKSSGLNKNYGAQIQRVMRKFQSRRITVDDIYSYSGALNKIGGMGEMVLPAGRGGDFKVLEHDTIDAVNTPINIEFLEQQRRQAITGTGVPQLLVINAIDEVDFAKTLELANARYLSAVSSYKIDLNRGITKLYRALLRYTTDLEEDVIRSFNFQFNQVKQQELNITSDMIQNFNNQVEVTMAIYFKKNEMEDEKGNPTNKQMLLRRELAKVYLPQLDFDNLEEIVKRVNRDDVDLQLQDKVADVDIEDEDLDDIKSDK